MLKNLLVCFYMMAKVQEIKDEKVIEIFAKAKEKMVIRIGNVHAVVVFNDGRIYMWVGNDGFAFAYFIIDNVTIRELYELIIQLYEKYRP